jgi:transcriptional regulator with XRE-family HTH domain
MDSVIYSSANDLCYGANMFKDSPSETLGERLVRLRLQRGWRYQKELAKAIGVDPSTLNQIEKDRRPPSSSTTDALARVLGVTRDEIIDGETGPRSPMATSPTPSTRAQRDQRAQTTPAVQPDAFKDIISSSGRGGSGSGSGQHGRADAINIEPPDVHALIRTSALELLFDLGHAILEVVGAREESEIARRQATGTRAAPPARAMGHRKGR